MDALEPARSHAELSVGVLPQAASASVTATQEILFAETATERQMQINTLLQSLVTNIDQVHICGNDLTLLQ